MDLLQIDSTRRDHVKRFLQLPFRLYRTSTQWVPPIESDVRLQLNRQWRRPSSRQVLFTPT